MRIVSLLPAATEIVGLLGLSDHLVGISHECDYPPEVNDKPRVTHCEIYGTGLPSAEVDRWVRETLASTGDLYTLDEPLLRRLRPDVILTQRLCDVCAVGYGSVTALAATLPGPPQVVNLEPSSLADIFANIRHVAEVLRVPEQGERAVASLLKRVEAVRARSLRIGRRLKCFLMEWIDPPFCSGHWGPELIEIAGGEDPLGRKGQDSTRILWESVLEAQPEVLVLACCGYRAERTLQDLPILQSYAGWDTLSAVRQGRVYVVDGSAYFSRHGPRIVDSLEILAHALHPDVHPLPDGLPAPHRVGALHPSTPAQPSSGSSEASIRRKPKALLAWSSGKDSAWALHLLRQQDEVQIVGLLTTFNEAFARVAMHAVRRELVELQAAAASLPLWPVLLPWPCPNEEYERRMQAAIAQAREQGITHMVFGDLFLQDIRAYRERMLAGTGIAPLFPLWGTPADTPALARQMLAGGLRAVLSCVDLRQISEHFAGRRYDEALLADLPTDADPCGEKGEFHTFCYDGPMFSRKINVRVGKIISRDGFHFADLLPADAGVQ